MLKTGYFLMFISVFAVLLTLQTSSFAFQCVGPGDNNCLQCHVQGDIHNFHIGRFGDESCTFCHCGSECELLYIAPVDTHCCTTCHDQCFKVNEHTLADRIDCTVCHNTTPIGLDDDCDGICNPEQSDQSCTGSDNCAEIPNGPNVGTCTSGNIGEPCLSSDTCGTGGVCSMNQEDIYPPQTNDIGDACDCEGNFDCDEDVDGSDASSFKADFGRNSFSNPCTSGNPCNGDFDCDSDCDGTDAARFKADFGRSSFNNPCPACVMGDWCAYP